MTAFLRHKTSYVNYFWTLTLMKQAHLTTIKPLTLTVTEDMTRTQMLQMGPKVIFDQGHRTLGIVVVSILSLEVPEEWGYKRHLMWTRILQQFFHLLDLTILNSLTFCYPVVVKQVIENCVRFWFKIYWKWVQGILILNLPQDEDKTHKSVTWQELEDGNSNIRQLQDHVCGIVYAQPNRNVQLPNFSVKDVKLHCAWTCISEFTMPRYISETLDHYITGKTTL
jgi:hypothetical protein